MRLPWMARRSFTQRRKALCGTYWGSSPTRQRVRPLGLFAGQALFRISCELRVDELNHLAQNVQALGTLQLVDGDAIRDGDGKLGELRRFLHVDPRREKAVSNQLHDARVRRQPFDSEVFPILDNEDLSQYWRLTHYDGFGYCAHPFWWTKLERWGIRRIVA